MYKYIYIFHIQIVQKGTGRLCIFIIHIRITWQTIGTIK